MKIQFAKVLGFAVMVGGTLFLNSQPGFAQMGEMQYQFNSRAEVVPALKRARGNLRQTYNVIICASRHGYNRTATAYYESLVVGKEFDASAQDSAAFAFAYDLGSTNVPWNILQDNAPNLIKKSTRATAMTFRERAFKLRPTSPEILVMRCIWQSGQSGSERIKAHSSAQQALKRAPRWADAYYWSGQAAHGYGMQLLPQTRQAVPNPKVKAQIARLGRYEMQAYDNAERLDPSLKSQLYLMRAEACNFIADKNSATKMLQYVDAHLRAVPEYLIWLRKNRGMDARRFREIYRSMAADIQNSANL